MNIGQYVSGGLILYTTRYCKSAIVLIPRLQVRCTDAMKVSAQQIQMFRPLWTFVSLHNWSWQLCHRRSKFIDFFLFAV